MLTYTNTFMYQANNVTSGITDETKKKNEARIQEAIKRVQDKTQEYGFVSILKNTEIVEKMKQVFHGARFAKTLVVVGIGGSDLGGRAIQQAIEAEIPPMDVIFHGDSTDPVQISRLLKQIDLLETVFCIVSKSGETIETISQYVLFKSYMVKLTDDWSDHFIFLTDQKKGVLREEADKHGVVTLPIPDEVGGRFSVQTTVGLFPALAMGVDIDALIKGCQSSVDNFQAIAQQIATDQYLLSLQGQSINVMMPYSVQLEEFARWYRQLWAESTGKNGDQGILPIQARGPADQHSQGQFYMQGKLMQSVLFLRVNERPENFDLEKVDLPAVDYLAGHSFHEIINVEQEATSLALKKLGRPSATLAVDKVNENGLGELFMVFELAVVYLAEMMGVNAFDQPGVEEGKQLMYALLGRSGWEEKMKEIEQLKK